MSTIADFNNTKIDYPSKTLPQLFAEQVKKTPKHIALYSNGKEFSYAELDKKTNQLAHYLKQLSSNKNPYIAIYMERSPDLIIGILSILKAGGAYVPLDMNIPKERMHYIFANSQVSMVLTDSSCLDSLPNTSVPILCMDKITEESKHCTDEACDYSALKELAYIIFTSGSTGQPKGVMTEHQAICNTLSHFRQAMQVQPTDVLLAITTITFDPSILDIFLPLISGAKLIVAPYSFNREPALIEECLQTQKVTMLQTTPATWKALIHHGWQGSPELMVMSMGEPLTPDLAQQLVLRSKCIWNLYGPTELAIYSTAEQITRQSDLQLITIGKPIANVQLHILDEMMRSVSIGAAGELYIGGKGIGRGYINPELTKERYVPPLFSNGTSSSLYKTGDLCAWMPDGRVKIFGRLDFQVKIRGFRVELGEIEMVLKGHEQIRDAIVLAKDAGEENKQLICYYLTKTRSESLDHIELQRYLKDCLPEYMVPFSYTHLLEFPLNANGKVDRKALPQPTIRRETSYQAPENALEKQIKTIWEEVLAMNDMSVSDSIFSLGGNSLVMMSILTQVSHSLHTRISFHEFYQNPNIAGLARLVAKKQQEVLPTEPLIIENAPVNILSEAQLNLWLINKFHSRSSSLTIVERRRFQGSLDSQILDFALACLMQKYPILSCLISAALPIQKQQPKLALRAERFTLSLTEQEQRLQESLIALKTRKWKKGQPLLHLVLFDLADCQSELHLAVSHLVADKISVDLLFTELSDFYSHYGTEKSLNLSSPSYMNYVNLKEHSLKKTIQTDLHFWEDYLKDISPFTLPTQDLLPTKRCQAQNCKTNIQLPEETLKQLQTLSNQHQVSLLETLNAIIATALIQYDQPEGKYFMLTLVKSGREHEAEQQVMGNCIQGNIIKISWESQVSIMELAKKIHQSVIDSEQFQGTYSCVKYRIPSQKGYSNKILLYIFKLYVQGTMKWLKLFYKINLNRDFFYRYAEMIAAMILPAKKKNPRKQPIQVTVNVLNNFLLPSMQSALFNYPLTKVEEYQSLGVSNPNALSFLLSRDELSDKRYLSVQGNVRDVCREKLLQQINKLIVSCSTK